MQLSKAQKEVVSLLQSGFFVWTNEGRNFKVWVGDEKGKLVKKINRRTGEALVDKKIIEWIDGDYPLGLFKYRLVGR